MKNNKLLFTLITLLSIHTLASSQKTVTIKSPDGNTKTEIVIGNNIEYNILNNGDTMLAKSRLSMTLTDGIKFGVSPKLLSMSTKSVNEIINAVVYKKSTIIDNYNELTLKFRGDYNIIFRAYNEGVAYRFVSTSKRPFVVENEQAEFNFPSDRNAFIPYVRDLRKTLDEQFFNSFENQYTYMPLSKWDKTRLAFSPLVIEAANGKKVCLAEADLVNYPGMFLYKNDTSNCLKGKFATYPKDIVLDREHGVVKTRENFIAKFSGATNFPWRVIIISQKDAELANNDMIYKLATATQNQDFSWVKPGKSAWDWWSNWRMYNVNFKAGINTNTYKNYIDFAAKFGLQYIVMDEGWSANTYTNVKEVKPGLDLKWLIDYGKSKNISIILWMCYSSFSQDVEGILKQYSEMGIKGFKIDFMDRDDQPIISFYQDVAKAAAKYKLLIDFHGTSKPAGIQRTYPNVINFEGVHGMEQLKFNDFIIDQVTYDVTIPFIRMVAGPMDYTQGAMRNASKKNYRASYEEPMSQGTRCRQLAEYVIFESPLSMLCDSPTDYSKEENYTQFLGKIPTVWDNTISLNGEIAHYVTIARQKGDEWYIGSLTDWNERELSLDLSFIGKGNFRAEVYKDGINTKSSASDYVNEDIEIPTSRILNIKMASGGGYVMRIYRTK